MLYTVGEMAKRLNVAPSTLRYYDKKGLLPFVQRSKGQIRIFREEDYRWLQLIHYLKQAGLQLNDIREFVHLAMQNTRSANQRFSLLCKQLEIVRQQEQELEETDEKWL